MYQNIHIKRGTKAHEIHIWDDQIGYQQFSFKPYAYLKSKAGTYQSLYGDKLKKVTYWGEDDLKAGRVFESDVPIATRVLVDKYGDSSDVSEGHRELYFDIEVEVKDGFPDPNTAENKITAIAFYDKVTEHYTCLILGNVKNYSKGNRTIESFESETDLLQRFYQKYLEINPTILSGWNISGDVGKEGFDIPYLYHRTQRVLGQQIANCLSPIGTVYYDENKKQYKIAGVSCLDYMSLYKLFTYTQQSSYRLDYIGQLEVGIGKIEYEGTLDDLYKTDINKYIEYNLNDVVIVKALDDKLKFIDLARGVAHLGHVPYEDVYYSSRYLEGAILVYMKDIGVIAPNKKLGSKINKDGDKFAGAYVKDPIPGRYKWVYDLDLTSMYPSTIMTLNISPETKLGKLIGWNAKEFIKGVTKTYTLEVDGREKGKYSQDELKEMFDNNKVSVSSNGVMYRLDRKGLIPVLLEKWFNERVEYKALMKKHGDAGEDDKYGYFKRRQHVQKIILNSLYGVLGLPVFRFYDIDNAEATTLTGQDLIKFTETITNHYYNKELGDKEDYCIYTDTDSVFYPALPLVQKRYPDADVSNDEFMTEQILLVAKEVQDFINNGYNYFATKFLNVRGEHKFDIKQECVAKSAFWVTKKRYGQWIINDGGIKCDKLDVKGLDIVKSNFPPAMRDLMTKVLKDILADVDKEIIDEQIYEFKKKMKTLPIYDIASPTGVRGLNKYMNTQRTKFKGETIFTETKKGTPVHVKSALIYNDLLKHFGCYDSEPIRNNEKIKWVYMKQNPLGVVNIALKGYDDPDKILEFVEQYIDRDKIFEGQLQKKINMFYDAMGWNFQAEKNENVGKFF